MMNKMKILPSLLVIFGVVLSTGIASAVSPFEGADSSVGELPGAVESTLPKSIMLEDSAGLTWNLNIALGCVLHGTMEYPGLEWPAYGFIFGDEMVLWADGPGTRGWVDSFAYTGMCDFETMTFDGFGVNYPYGDSMPVEMWLAGTTSGEETETGQNPLIAQSGAASNTEDSGVSPMGEMSSEKVKTDRDIPDRGAICFEDAYGYVWDLDLAYGCLYYGTMTQGIGRTYPAYGFIFGDEAFYWCDDYYGSFVYTGMWNSDMTLFDGTWVDSGGGSSTVELWQC